MPSKKLWEIIKEIEEKNGLGMYYLHHEYNFGELELNIEFDNRIADEILNKSNITESDSCAYWE